MNIGWLTLKYGFSQIFEHFAMPEVKSLILTDWEHKFSMIGLDVSPPVSIIAVSDILSKPTFSSSIRRFLDACLKTMNGCEQ